MIDTAVHERIAAVVAEAFSDEFVGCRNQDLMKNGVVSSRDRATQIDLTRLSTGSGRMHQLRLFNQVFRIEDCQKLTF